MTRLSSLSFISALSMILSSTVESVTNLYTYTCFFCPIRCALSIACRSTYNTTSINYTLQPAYFLLTTCGILNKKSTKSTSTGMTLLNHSEIKCALTGHLYITMSHHPIKAVHHLSVSHHHTRKINTPNKQTDTIYLRIPVRVEQHDDISSSQIYTQSSSSS